MDVWIPFGVWWYAGVCSWTALLIFDLFLLRLVCGSPYFWVHSDISFVIWFFSPQLCPRRAYYGLPGYCILQKYASSYISPSLTYNAPYSLAAPSPKHFFLLRTLSVVCVHWVSCCKFPSVGTSWPFPKGCHHHWTPFPQAVIKPHCRILLRIRIV